LFLNLRCEGKKVLQISTKMKTSEILTMPDDRCKMKEMDITVN
jgi:hypothetical protein